ncbi:MAG: signal recognition particle-docking protein FtsY [Bifidobacteriaceae bacterium]|jgi:fused signal recognition particle receptor|nr:signal recognition particle-docking protein FtsY [Bifidobacteriaceae bacterium]
MEFSVIIWVFVFVIVAIAAFIFVKLNKIFKKLPKIKGNKLSVAASKGGYQIQAPKFSLSNIFAKSKSLDQIYSDLEYSLISSDVGLSLTNKIIANIKALKPKTAEEIRVQAKKQLLDILSFENSDFKNNDSKKGNNKLPIIYLFVGVNGVGKTTTLGKIAKKESLHNKKLVFAAADTFRAAAQQQLETWAKAVDAKIVKGESQDPASVAYKAVDIAIKDGADMVFIDTAGRLHNKTNLVEELKKIVRVTEKLAPITQIFLVLDAMTGQNGLNQAKVFVQAVNATGVILTKMDGTAKGGVIFSIQKELNVGVKYIGLGESVDALVEFNPEQFIDSILN